MQRGSVSSPGGPGGQWQMALIWDPRDLKSPVVTGTLGRGTKNPFIAEWKNNHCLKQIRNNCQTKIKTDIKTKYHTWANETMILYEVIP